ncbi:hypothetical protein OSS47_00450 [Pseudomonas citronellolis]|uniref:hypothetical protein n=1 Tax=Pseudomonas citronellolis TaxID=53408 RepID=UPI00226F8633|nr:hypothetical protein [Pseudomonas citronellolis]WAB92484.1 hypothetical protein OSS47_00450 [Pseudomonas citronellolis]
MAKKAEYIVIDGCIQEGKEVFLPGQPYSPPTAEIRDDLVGRKVIAVITDPAAQAAIRAASAAAPADEDEGGAGDDLLRQGGGS